MLKISKHNTPLVTICIPTRNSEATIRKTLQSIICQTYKNIKIKIVDNASTDGTLDIVNSFRDKKIKIYKFSTYVKTAEQNFNRCTNLSEGKYTTIYHSDDLYNKNIIYKQVCFLEKNKATGAVFTEGNLIDCDYKKIEDIKVPIKKNNDNFNYSYYELLQFLVKDYNFLLCPTAMVRSHIYKKEFKKFNHELYGNSADLDMWLRIAKKYHVGIIKQNLISYRISKQQETVKTRNLNILPSFFKVIDSHLSKETKKKMNNEFAIDYYDLKIYIYLSLIIALKYHNNNKYLSKVTRKFYSYCKKRNKFYLSKKFLYTKIIISGLYLVKKFPFLEVIFIRYLHFKFYKTF